MIKAALLVKGLVRHKKNLLLLTCCICLSLQGRHVVLIDKQNKLPVSEREAILILPGFGTIFHNTRNQVENFQNRGYDVFIPDYISRKSLQNCVKNLEAFITRYKLRDYKKLHVFSYIIGSWTINMWMSQNPGTNIASVVYDRSPLQEKAPAILTRENPILSRLLFGKLIGELSDTPYPPLVVTNIPVGLMIECKATKIMWKKRRSLEKMEPVTWDKDALGQKSNDWLYIFLNHDDMYTSLEDAAPQVLFFFKARKFKENADREPCSRDPFENFKKH
jgi:hypothetical protein